jgi:hypothetical protein
MRSPAAPATGPEPCMDKRFWVCGIVVAVAALLLDFLVHGVLLRGDYAPLAAAGLYRGPAEANATLPWMFAAHLLIGFGLTWLYRKGIDSARGSLGQGLRFGTAIAVMATIPGYLIYYAVQPLPEILVLKQIVFSTVAMLLLGLLLAWLNPARRAL